MRIIQGSGNSRKVIELPHGSVFAQAAKSEPREYADALNVVADLTLGNEKLVKLSLHEFKRITARTLRLPQMEIPT